MDNCIFCKIIMGEIPSKTVYEDDLFKVILDVSPATKGHALILPKNHCVNIFDMGEVETTKIFGLAKKVAAAMKESLKCDGINIIQNNGEAAGQSVFHFHLHIIPRYWEDGQNLLWKPGSSDNGELEKIADAISQSL